MYYILFRLGYIRRKHPFRLEIRRVRVFSFGDRVKKKKKNNERQKQTLS